MRPRIALTIGDPAGIGPEVLVKALSDPQTSELAEWTVVGDALVLREAQERYSCPLPEGTEILDLAALDGHAIEMGRVSAECGSAALAYVRKAVDLCLGGRVRAMVTAPVNKEAVTMSGIPFSGHTGYIAELCGVRDPSMMLVNDRLRVVHVSTHVALRQACELDPDRILRTIVLGCEALERLGVANRTIAVCGLNPHAGENGLFGDEDARSIRPAVERATAQGIPCVGPVPADTVFLKAVQGSYALVVAMYHDQGHIPMKLLDFEHTVNISLGLPIIRTSVDHGTAFDIAGKNRADPTNMKTAMRTAALMVGNRAAAR